MISISSTSRSFEPQTILCQIIEKGSDINAANERLEHAKAIQVLSRGLQLPKANTKDGFLNV